MLFTLKDLKDAAQTVGRTVKPTPAYRWPLLVRRTGIDVIVKHENQTPTGSFKARGGLVYVDRLQRSGARPKGLVTATRGNHGQSVAIGASRAGLPVRIVVPEGNSAEKNAAMAAFGAGVVTAGRDFDESRSIAAAYQASHGYDFVPSFHPDLVTGVATYAYELFLEHGDIDAVLVPVGMGSGICGLIGVRDLLGLKTEIIGVVAETAPAFADSFEAGVPRPTATARTFADGVACRDPQPEPLDIILKGASDMIRVSEDEIAEAVRIYFSDTHNIAEGAGAAPLAALMRERHRFGAKRVALILTGGNIDLPAFAAILAGRTPLP